MSDGMTDTPLRSEEDDDDRAYNTCDAVNHLVAEMKIDSSYREGWKANIAVQFQDSVRWYKKKNNKRYLSSSDIHKISNEAADNFLDLLGNVIAG